MKDDEEVSLGSELVVVEKGKSPWKRHWRFPTSQSVSTVF